MPSLPYSIPLPSKAMFGIVVAINWREHNENGAEDNLRLANTEIVTPVH